MYRRCPNDPSHLVIDTTRTTCPRLRLRCWRRPKRGSAACAKNTGVRTRTRGSTRGAASSRSLRHGPTVADRT